MGAWANHSYNLAEAFALDFLCSIEQDAGRTMAIEEMATVYGGQFRKKTVHTEIP